MLDGVNGKLLRQEIGHGGIIDSADGNSGSPVDLRREVSSSQIVVEGGELRVLRKQLRDVVSPSGGNHEEEHGKEHCPGGRAATELLHCES